MIAGSPASAASPRAASAGQIEALIANLVSVNRRYKAHAGLRITDIYRPNDPCLTPGAAPASVAVQSAAR